jgi:hypothetical protein
MELVEKFNPHESFIGPMWCLDRPAVKLVVMAESARRRVNRAY